jgi:hypothetical protein
MSLNFTCRQNKALVIEIRGRKRNCLLTEQGCLLHIWRLDNGRTLKKVQDGEDNVLESFAVCALSE